MIKFFVALTLGFIIGAGGMFYYRHDVSAREAQIQQTKRQVGAMTQKVNDRVQDTLK